MFSSTVCFIVIIFLFTACTFLRTLIKINQSINQSINPKDGLVHFLHGISFMISTHSYIIFHPLNDPRSMGHHSLYTNSTFST